MARTATPQLTARLDGVRNTVSSRLDRLSAYFPEMKPRGGMDFTEYMARASVHSERDPDFAQQLQAAMQQYTIARGVLASARGGKP